MKFLIIIGSGVLFIFLCIYCVSFRLFVLNPLSTIRYAITDIYKYFKYHKYDWLDPGKLIAYIAHFGGGKTLSVTEWLCFLFKRYNNKYVYDEKEQMWKLQKVHILSNVEMKGVSCEALTSMHQVVDYGERNRRLDSISGTRTVMLVLLDEASTQLNSRNYKDNFSWETLNTLLTSRHLLISFYYTTQKFKLADALLRSVTQQVISCKKNWRFMCQYVYDADELELATDVSLLKPLYTKGFFIKDKHFNAYDTLALVTKLKKDMDKGNILSDQEVLELRGQLNPDNDAIINPSRKLKRMRKRK